MKLSVQVIVHPDDDTDDVPTAREVFTLDRDDLSADTLGLQLTEANDLLVAVQDTLVEQQVQAAVAAQVGCPHCGKPRRHKDTRTIVVRSLFGVLRLPSPRWGHCACRDHHTRTFGPLAAVLPERTTPELAYLQARFAGSQANYHKLTHPPTWRHASVVLLDTSVVVVTWTGCPGGTHANDCSTRLREERRAPLPAYGKSEDFSTFGLA